MNNQPTPPQNPQPQPQQPPQFTINHIKEYIDFRTLIEGEKPKEVRVKQDVFNWYREHRRSVGDIYNMGDYPKKDIDMLFMGVKLIPVLELKK